MDQLALLAPAPGSEAWCAQFREIHVDLGTGDAAWALRLARQRPEVGVIGVDACLDHVRGHARRRPANMALIQCDAAALPAALDGRATRVTINFPYGSLLSGLLEDDARLRDRLDAILTVAGVTEVRVNASALAGTGHTLATAERALVGACGRLGCVAVRTRRLESADLRRFPSTWAKRIGFGREPVAIEVTGARRPGRAHQVMLP